MQVAVGEFIKSPALYLSKIGNESVQIIKDGRAIAVLAKPDNTPIANSLLGLLKETGITCVDDIKAMKVGV